MTLWTHLEAEAATLGKASAAFAVGGISIDTRTLKEGDLFVALQGDNRDGHDYVRAAFDAKAGAALVARAPEGAAGPLLTVGHTQRGLEDLARAVARPQPCQDFGRHRQRGQNHHQGNPAPGLPCAGPHPCLGRLLQQSLGCAAELGFHAARYRIRHL